MQCIFPVFRGCCALRTFVKLAKGDTSSCIATRAATYRSLRTLRARNRKKRKGSFKILGVRRKVSKKPEKCQKIPIFGQFWVFLDFFRYFLGLFCAPPKRPFLRLFCDFGPGGSGDSCKWRLGSQFMYSIRAQSLRELGSYILRDTPKT